MPQISVTTPETLDVLGAPLTIVAAAGPSCMAVTDHLVPSGYGVPLHVHRNEDEAFFILEGEVTLLSEHGEQRAGAGTRIDLPRGIPHGFRNDTPKTVRMMILCGPQAVELFRHLDRTRPALPDAPAICSQYGVDFLPPAAP